MIKQDAGDTLTKYTKIVSIFANSINANGDWLKFVYLFGVKYNYLPCNLDTVKASKTVATLILDVLFNISETNVLYTFLSCLCLFLTLTLKCNDKR